MESSRPDPIELFYEVQGISPTRRAFDRFVTRLIGRGIAFVLQHWLALMNWMNGLTTAGAFLAPYLLSIGLDWLGKPLFISYKLICPQRPDHSFFLFGQQMAMEQRMVAIYAAMFLGGLLFALVRDRLRPIRTRWLVVLSLPMLIDVFTQIPGWRESNGELRVFTGSIFGLAVVWWAYPYIERAAKIVQVRHAKESAGGPQRSAP